MSKKRFTEFIHCLAAASGEVIRPFFANPDLEVESKADRTPVTLADRRAEEIMRRMIRQEFPSHGIIGEEFGEEKGDSPYVWVLDPIDGTKPFSAGCPLFGTLICLLKEGHPWIGAIHQPVLDLLLLGDNERTTLNGNPVTISNQRDLSNARLLVSDLKNPGKFQNGRRWMALVGEVEEVLTWGDCYGYLLLATGGGDIMVDPIMNPWDIMALIPIVAGAGGVITDWQGNDPVKGNSIVAANAELHPQVLAILNTSGRPVRPVRSLPPNRTKAP